MKKTYEGYLYLGRVGDETYWLLFPKKLSLNNLKVCSEIAEAEYSRDYEKELREDLDDGYINCLCFEDLDPCLHPEKLGGTCLDDELADFMGKKVRITIEVIGE